MAVPASQSTLTVGDIRVHFLPDGWAGILPAAYFPGSTPDAWKRHTEFLDDQGRVVSTLGCFLVERGDQNVLVDAAGGPLEADIEGVGVIRSGRMLESLAALGRRPEDIQRVLLTHLHSDHVGWLVDQENGGAVFTRATHLVGSGEREHWPGSEDPFAPPQPVQDFLAGAGIAVSDGHEVMPGVTVVETHGHTPGHVSVVLSSGTARAIILGDVVHCAVQLQEADWACFADVDPKRARETRDRLWAELEASSTVAAASHMSDYSFGRIAPAEGAHQWLMAEGVTRA